MPRPALALAVLLLAAPAQVARAQAPQPSAADREAEYLAAFEAGLEALTKRELARSETLFKRCVQLFPDRAVAHYNLACTYSIAGKLEPAVAALRTSFERGFIDLAHVARDTDLDAIRRSPAFRAAVSELEQRLLADVGPLLTHVPEGAPRGAVVWVHDQGARPEADLAMLRAALPDWVVLVPQGVATPRGVAWDGRCEWLVTTRLRAFWAERGAALRAHVVAEGALAPQALELAANNPDLFQGVLAAGSNLGYAARGAELAGLRAYLVVAREDPGEVAQGVVARDAFLAVGAPVVLEHYPLPKGLSKDRALLLRGLGWLAGSDAKLPGAGEELPF